MSNHVTIVFNRNAKFIPCDVTSWEDQLAMFKSAMANSPRKSVDIVVANAGISGPDEAFNIEGKRNFDFLHGQRQTSADQSCYFGDRFR